MILSFDASMEFDEASPRTESVIEWTETDPCKHGKWQTNRDVHTSSSVCIVSQYGRVS